MKPVKHFLMMQAQVLVLTSTLSPRGWRGGRLSLVNARRDPWIRNSHRVARHVASYLSFSLTRKAVLVKQTYKDVLVKQIRKFVLSVYTNHESIVFFDAVKG